jgi:hypothetical protein
LHANFRHGDAFPERAFQRRADREQTECRFPFLIKAPSSVVQPQEHLIAARQAVRDDLLKQRDRKTQRV